MKHVIVFFAVAMMSLISFADGELLPPDHSMCLNADNPAIGQSCERGTTFLIASDGRCGCLASTEYHKPNFCMVANIRCEPQAPYASLYRRSMANGGDMTKIYAGCGCFTTFDGMHATSIE